MNNYSVMKNENGKQQAKSATPKMGEIWWADIDNNIGHQQGGHRPVLVVSNNVGNRFAPIVDVFTITSSTKKWENGKMPQHAFIPANSVDGLDKNSVVLTENMWHLNKEQLKYRIGMLPDELMKDVAVALFHQCPFLKLAVDAGADTMPSFLRIVQSA
jgi:mRNA interferase MazF